MAFYYGRFPQRQAALENRDMIISALLELFPDEDIFPVIHIRRENYGMIALLPI